jgi:hypothetical protein
METQKHPMIQSLALVAGISLIAGIFFPIIFPGFGIIFPEFRMLTMHGIGIFARIGAIFPLISAVLIFVGRAQPQYLTRAIFYFIAGFLPILLALGSIGELGAGMGRMGGGGGLGALTGLFSIGLFGYIMGLGLLGMMSAAIAGSINPQSPLVGYAALAGGGLMGLSMIFPVGLGSGGGITVMLIMPFQAMSESFFVGFVLLLFVAGMIAAAAFSILWGINQKNGVNNANMVKYLVIGTFAICSILLLFVGIFEMAGEGRFFGGMIMIITSLIHTLAMLIGGFLAKLLGIVEILTFTNAGPLQNSNATAEKGW